MRRFEIVLFIGIWISSAAAQTPVVTGVTNGASFTAGEPLTPGSLVSIFGTNLAAQPAQAASVPLSVSLGDVQSVTFDNVPAPLVYVNPTQLNVQVPWEVKTTGTTSVVVTRSSGASQAFAAPVTAVAPGIFAVNFGSGAAIAINADGSLAAPAGSIPGISTHPARIGDTILILCTGLGAVDQQPADGAAPSGLSHTLTTPVVMVGGTQAAVAFSGLSPQFPGVNQLNVVIPQGAPMGDAIPLQLQAGDITTSDQVTIAVSP